MRSADISSLGGKKILMRVDFDVPVREGMIQESYRVRKQAEAIGQLARQKAHVLLVAHISAIPSFATIQAQLSELVGYDLGLIRTLEEIQDFLSGETKIALLENIRMWPGEEANDTEFARQLSAGFDTYVNNAFAVAHREHASVAAITTHLDSYAGPLVTSETEQLASAVSALHKVVVMGGAKASTKIPVIKNLLATSDKILVGGVIANDFLKARGQDVQQSVVDENAAELLAGIDLSDARLVIPEDFNISDGKFLDIGSKSIEKFSAILRLSKVIVWNGPMGKFEDPQFMTATEAVAKAIIDSGALSIIGGGDTISAVDRLNLVDSFTFVSTGGGAMLAFLAGQQLPALTALGYYG